MLWTFSCYLQRLKNDAKQLNLVVFAMIWYLQRLKYEAKHNNVVAFVMLWMYSWYLQRLKCGRHTNIVVFSISASITMKNNTESLYLQCAGGIPATSSASNTIQNAIRSWYL
jgi:hypothetical protein